MPRIFMAMVDAVLLLPLFYSDGWIDKSRGLRLVSKAGFNFVAARGADSRFLTRLEKAAGSE